MCDRVGVCWREQDANPVEDHGSARLDEPAARLAQRREMIQITAQMRVLVAIEPVDGRKGIDSLARLCQEKLAEDPFSGCVFVFRSRSGSAIRLLSYDGQGYWLASCTRGRLLWVDEFFAKPFYHGFRLMPLQNPAKLLTSLRLQQSALRNSGNSWE